MTDLPHTGLCTLHSRFQDLCVCVYVCVRRESWCSPALLSSCKNQVIGSETAFRHNSGFLWCNV